MEGPIVGHVVTVLFPYTDLSGMKRRPAVVLAQMNEEDYLLCQVTTNTGTPGGILISDSDFFEGGLRRQSLVRCDRLMTSHFSIITKSVGRLKPEIFMDIRNKVLGLINTTHA